MTVKELIYELQKYDLELEICTLGSDFAGYDVAIGFHLDVIPNHLDKHENCKGKLFVGYDESIDYEKH